MTENQSDSESDDGSNIHHYEEDAVDLIGDMLSTLKSMSQHTAPDIRLIGSALLAEDRRPWILEENKKFWSMCPPTP